MDRREALKYTAFFMGAGLSATTISSILAGCSVDASDGWSPSFFTKKEADFIAELGETMLPQTHTPGAKDALVERYLDTVRPLRYTAEDNQIFKEKLTRFMAEAKDGLGTDFQKASQEERLEWLTAVDKDAYEAVKQNADLPDAERPFYLALKGQLLGAYFSSEVVAKEYFAFDPLPGGYEACIPYSDVGRAWALG